jgi:hypothetical protein
MTSVGVAPLSSRTDMRELATFADVSLLIIYNSNGVIGAVNTMLRRLYPKELADSNYSQTLSSLAFAGTVVG